MRCRAISCNHRTICLLRACHHRESHHLTLLSSNSLLIVLSSIFNRSSSRWCKSTLKGRSRCPTINLSHRLPSGLRCHLLPAPASHDIWAHPRRKWSTHPLRNLTAPKNTTSLATNKPVQSSNLCLNKLGSRQPTLNSRTGKSSAGWERVKWED